VEHETRQRGAMSAPMIRDTRGSTEGRGARAEGKDETDKSEGEAVRAGGERRETSGSEGGAVCVEEVESKARGLRAAVTLTFTKHQLKQFSRGNNDAKPYPG
jgi:hypothetical protein